MPGEALHAQAAAAQREAGEQLDAHSSATAAAASDAAAAIATAAADGRRELESGVLHAQLHGAKKGSLHWLTWKLA